MKASEWHACFDSESELDNENEKRKQIIDAKPSATVTTTNLQREDLEDPQEGESLFHSEM